MQLFYAVDGVGPFTAVPMSVGADGRFSATIPPAARRDVVQFYVQATDSLGAVSMFPAGGPESRALYKVDDNPNLNPLRHDFRLIMTADDTRALDDRLNMVNNNRQGATVIYDNQEVFYDVGGRLKGSMFSRQNIANTRLQRAVQSRSVVSRCARHGAFRSERRKRNPGQVLHGRDRESGR